MKIQHLSGQQPVSRPSGKSGGSAVSDEFRKLLDDRLQSISESKKAAAVERTESPATAANLRLQGLEMTEYTLRTLEDYENALTNTKLESRDLEPFVAALEEETTGLLSLRDQFPAEDPLAGLLDRVAAVAFLESAKFRRGDYTA